MIEITITCCGVLVNTCSARKYPLKYFSLGSNSIKLTLENMLPIRFRKKRKIIAIDMKANRLLEAFINAAPKNRVEDIALKSMDLENNQFLVPLNK